jgi:hypothetical protein
MDVGAMIDFPTLLLEPCREAAHVGFFLSRLALAR